MSNQQHWGTRLGVILAVAGSAVGLGNFLRFPGQAAANGGGAFLIPYFIALLLLGIPIGWAEWTMARYGGRKGLHSGPAIMGVAGKGSFGRYIGILSVLIPLAVSFYYTFIEAWCLGYAWHYLMGGIGLDPAQPATHAATAKTFFENYTGLNENGDIFGPSIETLYFWLITVAVNIFLVYRGLSGGIEKFCSLAMPAMAVCAFIVLIRVLTLGTPDPLKPDQNVLTGLGYMWNPNFSELLDPQTWLAAAGQIFFSLSVGFGVILNYASYLRKKDDIALSGLTAAATNEFFEVGFGGIITLTASVVFLGVSGTIAAVSGGTFGLGFQTLPVVFAQMGPAGNFIGFVWFFMLFLAAITSSISMYQPTLAFFEESLGISRKRGTTFLVTIAMIGSFLVMYYSKGLEFLSTIDDWVGTLLIFVLAGVQIFFFSWIFGLERGWEELHAGSRIRLPSFFKIVLKWIAPIYLLIIFIAFCYQNLPKWIGNVSNSPTQQGALLLIGVVALILIGCVYIGERRWRAEGLDIDDDKPLVD
ncbi:MAG: sodium-dependent transporter [Planctomycetota bacterium]|jgi:NSS family neurotransmitter:Na+ symporter